MKRACVVGWPIEHSRSPIIHHYWLKRHGIDGDHHTIIGLPLLPLLGYLREIGWLAG